MDRGAWWATESMGSVTESDTASEHARTTVPHMVLGSGGITVNKKFKNWHFSDVPGGLVVRTLYSQCRGPRVQGGHSCLLLLGQIGRAHV